MTYLYIYRLTSDTGLAPCVDNGLLSLACCKGGQIRNGKAIHTGLRYRVGAMRDRADYKSDDIYLLGTHKNKFLYLARVTNIVTMTKYFSKMSEGRTVFIVLSEENLFAIIIYGTRAFTLMKSRISVILQGNMFCCRTTSSILEKTQCSMIWSINTMLDFVKQNSIKARSQN